MRSLPVPVSVPLPHQSFRDPSGGVRDVDGRIVRVLTAEGAEELQAFLAHPLAGALVAEGSVPATWVPGPDAQLPASAPLVVEHDRIAFPSFPGEWAPPMLLAAGRLTLAEPV